MSNKWLYPVYGVIRIVANAYFSFHNALKARNARKIYIYTDSRGFKVDQWYCKKNPIGSYIARLAEKYKVDYSICRYKHTTLIDFLHDIQRLDTVQYDFIILHVGVVDFSPRPISQAKSIIREKSARIVELFGSEALQEFKPCAYPEQYFGEQTASLYSTDILEDYILPAINKISKKIIWIGVNPVLNDWVGNYDHVRPENINNILKYQNIIMANYLGVNLDVANWSEREIKTYTVDNIHLSDEGFLFVFNKILRLM